MIFRCQNLTKTETCVLGVQLADTQVQHVDHFKYLGVTLDRSLTKNAYLTKPSKKVAARVNWGDHLMTYNPYVPYIILNMLFSTI
jgi:hypothetical protein